MGTVPIFEGVRVEWQLGNWCNYQCDYCGVMVFSRRTGERQPHAFDYYPVEEWLAAFERLPQSHVLLKVLGGEPFLDRENWKRFLEGILPARRFQLEVFTNGSWNAEYYRDVAGLENVQLVVSFHASQTKFAPWRERLLRIRDAGFRIVRAATVLAPENLEEAEQFLTTLEADGIRAAVTPMLAAGMYQNARKAPEGSQRFTEELVPPAHIWMKALRHKTKGMPCYYPALTYEVNYDGTVKVACLDGARTNFVTDPLPPLPREAVACPLAECLGCVAMVYSIPGNPFLREPVKVFSALDYADEIAHYEKVRAGNPDYLRGMLSGTRMPGGETDCYTAFLELEREEPKTEAAPEVLVDRVLPALPEAPAFGYLDALDTPLEADAMERVYVGGWACSRTPLGRPGKVRLEMAGKTVGVFEDFVKRQDVYEHFGRREMLETGFGGLVFVPAVRPGSYELAGFVVDHDGAEYAMPPRQLRIRR